MKIRKYKSTDCAEIAELFYQTVHEINARDYTKQQLDVWATGNIDISAWDKSFLEHNTLIAEEDNIIVGFGDMDNSGYLDRLYVHKDYQGKGIATAIVGELEKEALMQGVSFFTTHASITAKPFFEKQGYVAVRENKVVRGGIELINYIMEKKRLILRKFEETDAGALLEILSDTQVNTFLPWFPLKDINEAQSFLQTQFLDYYNDPSSYRYAICLKEDNIPIGYVWLSSDESHDFGYGLRKEFWNKGIVTEAARAVVDEIKKAGYTYITATHDRNNLASGEVMKKLGMEYKYSYVEQWQPKDVSVTFRMYQLNFDGDRDRTYMEYWNKYENHFIEENLY